jgi:hypothetical protein
MEETSTMRIEDRPTAPCKNQHFINCYTKPWSCEFFGIN